MSEAKYTSIIILSIILCGIPSFVFAQQSEITIEPAKGSGTPGCEETSLGCFIPSTATVDVGGKVIFSNTDSAAHTFTSGSALDADSVGAVFDSSLAMAGSSFEWSPTVVGEQPYFCIVHPWMMGTIIVQEGGLGDAGGIVKSESLKMKILPNRSGQECGDGIWVNDICQDISSGEGSRTSEIDNTILIGAGILGVIIVAVIGVVAKKKKSTTKTDVIEEKVRDRHVEEKTKEPPKAKSGKRCNVCGTNIPQGENICPSCGDAYS